MLFLGVAVTSVLHLRNQVREVESQIFAARYARLQVVRFSSVQIDKYFSLGCKLGHRSGGA